MNISEQACDGSVPYLRYDILYQVFIIHKALGGSAGFFFQHIHLWDRWDTGTAHRTLTGPSLRRQHVIVAVLCVRQWHPLLVSYGHWRSVENNKADPYLLLFCRYSNHYSQCTC